MTTDREVFLSVIMERKMLVNKWADFQWEALGVLPPLANLNEPRRIFADSTRTQWLFPALPLRLYADEAENYLANLHAPEPRVFITWRGDDVPEGGLPQPALLTVSYGEAARMMDSGERVDGVPMPPELRAWVGEYAARHYRPPERKQGRGFASQRGRPDLEGKS
jgi:hypothetical protein